MHEIVDSLTEGERGHSATTEYGYNPVEAIRLECRALREDRLLHPARPDAAEIIEAHLDQLLRLVAAWRIEVKP